MLQTAPLADTNHSHCNSSFLYQQARRDSVPHLVTSNSGAVYVVTSSERLTVELFWLEAQNTIVQARHIPGCLNVIADHLSRPNQLIPTEWSLHPEIVSRIFGVWGTPAVDMFATVSNSRLPQFMSPIPEPQALAVNALSQSGMAGEVDVHVSSVSPFQQGYSESTADTGARSDSDSPLVRIIE